VTIDGKYFGTTKVRVYLEYGEGGNVVRESCKVNGWTMDPTTGDTEIVFIVPPMRANVCDVAVDPYGALQETEENDEFTVKAPEIISVNPNTGSAGDQISIHGHFFGIGLVAHIAVTEVADLFLVPLDNFLECPFVAIPDAKR